MPDVDTVLKQIKTDQRLPDCLINEWIQNEKFEQIDKLSKAIVEVWDASPSESWLYAGSFDRIVRSLSLSQGQLKVEILLRVLSYRSKNDELMRRVAAQLASAQSPEVLNEVVASSNEQFRNLWAYLTQELVIEGIDLSLYPNLLSVSHSMQEDQHQLSVLPLELLSEEQEIKHYKRHYSISSALYVSGGIGSSAGKPFGTMIIGGNSDSASLDKLSKVSLYETTNPRLQIRLQSAFENWYLESNGKIEARQFTAQTAIDVDMITDSRLLLDLDLACLKGTSPDQIIGRNISATQVINVLFTAAANGGAYNQGLGNAYGRLYIWISVAALMNELVQTPITVLNEQMKGCLWFELDTDSAWFFNVWDAAIVALSRDRRVLTILAATDTD